MKALLKIIIPLFVISSCAFKYTVNGETKTYGSSNVLATLSDPTPAPLQVEISSGFSPNPKRYEELSSLVSQRVKDFKNTGNKCGGYISRRPSVVFQNNGLKNVRLTAPGGEVLFAEFEDGTFVCQAARGKSAEVQLESWPKGETQVWVGTLRSPGSEGQILKHSLWIEDYDVPRSLGWSDVIANTTLDGAPKDPLVFKGAVPPVASRENNRCRKFKFADVPVQRFSLKRPVADLELVLTSPFSVAVELVGPISPDNRTLPATCYKTGRNKIKRLEPGDYAIRVGASDPKASNQYHGMFLGPDSIRDKLFIVQSMHAGLPMQMKALIFHTPFLEIGAMQKTRELAQAAFLTAPIEMMVYPKFDLDKVSAKSWDNKVGIYPKKNEPLLLLRGRVVTTTDGLIYEMVKLDYLTETRPKTAIIPPKPRGPKDDRRKTQIETLEKVRNRLQ